MKLFVILLNNLLVGFLKESQVTFDDSQPQLRASALKKQHDLVFSLTEDVMQLPGLCFIE